MRKLLPLVLTVSAFAQGSWTRIVNVDKMTGKTSIGYSVVPITSQGTDYDRGPRLSLFCENGHVKLIDYWVGAVLANDPLVGDYSKSMIQYKLDNDRVRLQWWTDNGQHAFSKSAKVKDLLSANRLVLRASTFTGEVVTDEFNVSGLDTPQFHQDCGR
jgi:hypothetical protein